MMGARYGMPIDMWSLGCILAELLTGFPLLPGEDEADQMACIIELLGMPPQKLIEQGKRSKNFISSKGLPRYCTATTLPDGTTVLSGGMSRRGKPRGPPGSKSFVTALKDMVVLLPAVGGRGGRGGAAAGAGGAAGAAGGVGGRGGSQRTPLARTPVTFNTAQVAKAKLQAALSEESGAGRYWAAKLPHLPAPS
ncbi:Dual specificity tyrosine-phosphorylation-regulated kinase 2 [Papilio machaon]|uniref:Dual specificity tyrosine-phosphorylation-regulated kinase 2 n=1 Tax=Papilio machaon TaxID=76193 RepID=A0A0N1PFH0_PAPMA|nr:Dual specificity tyrosine-phosphorylation-regulated kinase 2 [Papilio machaon]